LPQEEGEKNGGDKRDVKTSDMRKKEGVDGRTRVTGGVNTDEVRAVLFVGDRLFSYATGVDVPVAVRARRQRFTSWESEQKSGEKGRRSIRATRKKKDRRKPHYLVQPSKAVRSGGNYLWQTIPKETYKGGLTPDKKGGKTF